jgi:hypothetical protein
MREANERGSMSQTDPRVNGWLERILEAPDGQAAFRVAVSFFLAEIKRLSATDPEFAEHARWQAARDLGEFAVILSRRRRTRPSQ